QSCDDVALVVGVKEAGLEAQLIRRRLDPDLELVQRQPPVVGRIPAAQLVEVDPVHDLDPIADAHPVTNSRTAPLSAPRETPCPGRGAPGASSSTNGTGSEPSRFLSRAVASTTASGSTPFRLVGSPLWANRPATWWRSSSWSES